mgnify:CR=1 FL=1
MENYGRKLVIVAAICFGLSACGMGKVESLKAGFISPYESLTVGEAFNGWSACSDTRWGMIETERNEEIVEFRCTQRVGSEPKQLVDAVTAAISDDKQAFEKQISGQRAMQQLMQNGALGIGTIQNEKNKFSADRYLELMEFNELNFLVQFSLSKQDDSFEVDWWGLEYSYPDGSTESSPTEGTVDDLLAAVYENEDPGFAQIGLIDATITELAWVPK